MLACGSRRGVVRPQRPRLFSIQVTIGIWDGARRGGRAGSRRQGFNRRGRDKAMGVGSSASWDRTFRWYVQGARGEGARRGSVLPSARVGNINRLGVDGTMYRTREQQQDGPGGLRLGLRGLDAVDARGLCGNQPVCRVHNSPRSHFSAMTRPCWLRRAVRDPHRHAIEQASRRWRGGRRDASVRTRRKILISTQLATTTSDMAPPCFESSRPASSISWETRNNPVALSVPKSAPMVDPTHARMTKTQAKAAAKEPEALPP